MRSVRRSVVAVVLIGLAMIGARVQASEPMKAIVASYLEIQGRLANDSVEAVKDKAHAIGEQAAKLDKGGAAIAAAAADVEKAADIKAARDAFGALSDAVVAAAQADGWTDVSGLKLAYCPMVKRSWLQSSDTLQNPYFGKAMSTCGEFRTMQ